MRASDEIKDRPEQNMQWQWGLHEEKITVGPLVGILGVGVEVLVMVLHCSASIMPLLLLLRVPPNLCATIVASPAILRRVVHTHNTQLALVPPMALGLLLIAPLVHVLTPVGNHYGHAPHHPLVGTWRLPRRGATLLVDLPRMAPSVLHSYVWLAVYTYTRL